MSIYLPTTDDFPSYSGKYMFYRFDGFIAYGELVKHDGNRGTIEGEIHIEPENEKIFFMSVNGLLEGWLSNYSDLVAWNSLTHEQAFDFHSDIKHVIWKHVPQQTPNTVDRYDFFFRQGTGTAAIGFLQASGLAENLLIFASR